MKKSIATWYFLSAALVITSCKKESGSQKGPDAFYEVTVDGFTVHFDNKTTGAVSYEWDFGDGTSSKEESPSHVYPGKGKFVPTLYAKDAGGTTSEASTVIYLSKPSSIKLDDNSLADWDTIQYNMVPSGPESGNFITSKYDYDGENVYIYFEQHTKKADGNIYDLYIDADNDITTGLLTGDIPNGAYEVLLEGTIFDDWLDPYYHSGDQNNFGGYAYTPLSEFYTIGTVKQEGDVLKFEFPLKRSKIKGLTGQALKIGVQVFTNDFGALIGWSPDLGSDAFFLDMSQ